jgi:hypothetical protein
MRETKRLAAYHLKITRFTKKDLQSRSATASLLIKQTQLVHGEKIKLVIVLA